MPNAAGMASSYMCDPAGERTAGLWNSLLSRLQRGRLVRCARCGEEILLARRCPYCGEPTRQNGRATPDQVAPPEAGEGRKARGRFRGRIGAPPGAGRQAGAAGPRWFWLLPYLADRGVPTWKKTLFGLAALYVLVPIDLLPGAIVPFAGWLDDWLVLAIAWRALASELDRYRVRIRKE